MSTEQQIISADEDMTLVSVQWRGMSFPFTAPFKLYAGCRYLATIRDRGQGNAPFVNVRVIDGYATHQARAAAVAE